MNVASAVDQVLEAVQRVVSEDKSINDSSIKADVTSILTKLYDDAFYEGEEVGRENADQYERGYDAGYNDGSAYERDQSKYE